MTEDYGGALGYFESNEMTSEKEKNDYWLGSKRNWEPSVL